LNHPSFKSERDTVIYHYGFTQTPETQSVVEIIQAYLSFGNVNFILVNYESVATNTLPVRKEHQSKCDKVIKVFLRRTLVQSAKTLRQ
jgi:hypothetical protein